MRHCRAVLIGGGCGGLAAASLNVVLIERDSVIINLCGFGLTTF